MRAKHTPARRTAKKAKTLPVNDPVSWAERCPLETATAFVALLLKCDTLVASPLAFTFGTVISCTSDEELVRVDHAVRVLRDLCDDEQTRRRVHGVQPRVLQS